jgi:RimK family alpha-L-glutamate ligase
MSRVRFAVVTNESTATDRSLASAAPAGVAGYVLAPWETVAVLEPGDVALGRLDVRDTLDGVTDGLWCLGELEARGVRVLNPAPTLLATHDKLLTTRLLDRAGIKQPETIHVHAGVTTPNWVGAAVVKPRHGSWGKDVIRCETEAELRSHLRSLQKRPWFARHGALVQELVPPLGYDLRILVAAGQVVGSIRRHAAPGEWRTNVALGATRVPIGRPPDVACELAVHAAAAVGGDLVGVDLLPTPAGSWLVLEVNGAVEFDATYASDDVHRESVRRLLADSAAPKSLARPPRRPAESAEPS